MTKRCSKCERDKPMAEFGKDKSRPGGLTLYCKECHNQISREWHSQNRGRYAAKQAEWQKRNREKCNEKAANYRIRHAEKIRLAARSSIVSKFGLTLEVYDEMYRSQGGLCAICEKGFDVLCVDHCHESGAVRGLLCRACNVGIGNLGDSSERLLRASQYLEKFSFAAPRVTEEFRSVAIN